MTMSMVRSCFDNGNMGIIFFKALLIMEILWIAEFSKKTSDLNFTDKYKAMFLTWGFYSFMYSFKSCIAIFGSGFIAMNVPYLIQAVMIISVIIIGMFIFVKGIDFNKYIAVFIVWGIYAVLALGYICIIMISGFNTHIPINEILIILSSVIMGIVWGCNKNKSKTIQ